MGGGTPGQANGLIGQCACNGILIRLICDGHCRTDDHWALLCVDKHPGQLHIVATGSQDGTLTIWDLRQNRFPMTTLVAHQSSSMLLLLIFVYSIELCFVVDI